MQCENINEGLVYNFLISVVSFNQGNKLCFTSEQEKGLNPITTTSATTKGISKRQAEFFLFFKKKKIYLKIFSPDEHFFSSNFAGIYSHRIIHMQYQTPVKN